MKNIALYIKRVTLSVLLVLLGTYGSFAQKDPNQIEAFFYANEKYYVVIAVVTIILIGILTFVIRLDRKIAKIEKDLENS